MWLVILGFLSSDYNFPHIDIVYIWLRLDRNTLGDVNVNGTVFLILNSACSLLVYECTLKSLWKNRIKRSVHFGSRNLKNLCIVFHNMHFLCFEDHSYAWISKKFYIQTYLLIPFSTSLFRYAYAMVWRLNTPQESTG